MLSFSAATSQKRIWLIGGTQDSAALARLIAQAQLPCIVTVTTEAARSLYPQVPELQIQVTRFTIDSLLTFLQQQQISAVLDASHPFAVEISQLAIAAAQQLQIPYLRYERPALPIAYSGSDQQTRPEQSLTPDLPNICLDSLTMLLAGEYLTHQRVLLTLGYRSLPLFQAWQTKSTLFARLLPSVVAIDTALAAGFTHDRLIALRPPISLELERALWQHWRISIVVTKASGSAGGEDIKRQVAAELGVTLITIARPQLTYPQKTSDLAVAMQFCYQHIRSEAICSSSSLIVDPSGS